MRYIRFVKLAAAFAVMACVVASAAASALAVSIEPLNTKFEATSEPRVEIDVGGTIWTCGQATIAGATNSTKTNYVNVTPSIAECSSTFGTTKHSMKYANSCTEKGTVPWTLTLTSGSGPFTGTTTLNCAATLTIDKGEACVVKVSAQTIEGHLEWATLKATSPFESKIDFLLGAIKYKGTGPDEGALCGVFGFKGEKGGENLDLTMRFPKVAGIKAG